MLLVLIQRLTYHVAEQAEAQVPETWHGVINKDRGTAVVIHP